MSLLTHSLPFSLLNADGELCLVLAKPPVAADQIKDLALADRPRPSSAALAEKLLAASNQRSKLSEVSGGKPAVVLFPEYAFGSDDWRALDTLVRAQPQVTLFFAGFGATLGSGLEAAVRRGEVQSSWPSSFQFVAESRYNAAWCWIHRPGESTQCFLILKHLPEQVWEAAWIPNFGEGQGGLLISAEDVSLAPLICADAVLARASGPRAELWQTLAGLDDPHRRVLVLVLAAESKPSHPLWLAFIDEATMNRTAQVAVACTNLWPVLPTRDEQDDRFRCLTGAFVSAARGGVDRGVPQAFARHCVTQGSSGFLLRRSVGGAAAGRFAWECRGATNRYVWRPSFRLVWRSIGWEMEKDDVELVELERWPQRVAIPAGCSSAGAELLKRGLGALRDELAAFTDAKKLWPVLLTGSARERCVGIDELGKQDAERRALEHAFQALAVLKSVQGFPLQRDAMVPWQFQGPMTTRAGQRGYVVWCSPHLSGLELRQKICRVALDWHVAEPTMVVAKQALGSPLPEGVLDVGLARPDFRTDFAADLPARQRTFDSAPRPAPVYHVPFASVEDLLVAREHDLAALQQALRTKFEYSEAS